MRRLQRHCSAHAKALSSCWFGIRPPRMDTPLNSDIDLWVMASADNAAVMRVPALVPHAMFRAPDFETEGTVLQIGVAPRRIDILTKIVMALF